MLGNKDLVFEDTLLQQHIDRAKDDRPIGHLNLTGVDGLIGGIRPAKLTVISGEPGVSKTTLVSQMCDDAASQGFACIFNTLEVPPHQLVTKSISRLIDGVVDIANPTAGFESVEGKAAIRRYKQEIAPNICFVEEPCSAVDLGAIISKALNARDKVILFVDYVQIMPTESEQRTVDERMAIKEAVSGLRRIANRHNVPVIAVSSVNRSTYGKSLVGLDALGGCNAIEYSADTVLFMSVEGKGEERAENMALPHRPIVVSALKNRYAPTGTVKLELDCEHALFRERA